MDKKCAPAYTIKGRKTDHQRESSPGPADYNSTNNNCKLQIAPSYSIPKNKNTDLNKTRDTPGPATYQIKQINHANGTTFSSKIQTKRQSNSPGPLDYKSNFHIFKRNNPNWKFNKQKRSIQNQQQIGPGPGNYNIPSKLQYPNIQSIKFGKQKRLDRKMLTQNTPGPGTYQYEDRTDKSGISFPKEKMKDQITIKSPGPGQYNLKSFFDSAKEKGKGFHLGLKCKTEVSRKDITPAPGFYKQTEINNIKKKNPAFTIQKSMRSLSHNLLQTPSPSHYKVTYSTFNKTGGAFNHFQLKDKIEVIPGPGEYQIPPKVIKQAPQYSFTKSSSIKSKLQKAPGPCSYYPNTSVLYQSKYKSQSIGKAQRNEKSKTNMNPGPGSYELKTETKTQISFTHEKKLDQMVESSPGPGQYNSISYLGYLPAYARSPKNR